MNVGGSRGGPRVENRTSNLSDMKQQYQTLACGIRRIYLAVSRINNFHKFLCITPTLRFVTGWIFTKIDI